ncbi:hypothetical protein WG68_05605 [Arsukibacterium ikkense]|uniref:Aminoglycoside phosphotransferase domain-containing protein n=1 Tax=Arsukibacterium ikkense TaxID=336831 RepID=A0A0M2VAT6_9GAMM|nr:phosphotransferase [Arsukibacterium ikkense]KKO46248.1 hypothetical protein WG68_05605 [Arsukibacterium ikkense]
MAGDLSAATATGNARQIAALCRHLEFFAEHPPLAITPLANGELNFNFLVETRRGRYVVRRYPVQVSGVCRQQELRCQHAAAIAGIAPAPLCLNNHQQVLISEFIDAGQPFVCSANSIPLLAGTLAQLHRLSAQTAVLQPLRYLQQQASIAGAEAAAGPLLARVLAVAKQYQELPQDPVLCHLDLHAGNVLWAGRKVWLLDFEFAQRADSYLDLAAVALYFQLSEAAEQLLLSAYTQHRKAFAGPPPQLKVKWLLAKIVFSGFCWLWYLSLPQHTPDRLTQLNCWQAKLEQLLALQAAQTLC